MDWNAVITAVEQLCRRKRAILLKVEPDAWENEDVGERLIGLGFRSDGVPVQPRRTIVVDLSGSETDWMGRMRQKTRYNIRLAERKEVQVHSSSQVQVFHELMQTTGQRDGFGVHSLEYYRQAYELFHPAGMVELFLAEYASRPLAGLMVFSHGKRAWYLYGASNDEERNRMPAYLLQWEAMRWATQRGCTQYDLWGVPDAGEEDLEAQFERRSDGLWGVYRFKRGFGGVLRRAAPTYEKALNLPLFWLYRIWARQRAVE
jgi:peptidoglycan pentaglycine glycine transferase (the first glycine)